jgi:hypothetical protein
MRARLREDNESFRREVEKLMRLRGAYAGLQSIQLA